MNVVVRRSRLACFVSRKRRIQYAPGCHCSRICQDFNSGSSSKVRMLLSPSSAASAIEFCIDPRVQLALQQNRPVVALESTIIAHGMPYPQNYQLATQIESQLRQLEVEPATIALRNGTVKIGLNDAELLDLAQAGGQPGHGRAQKCSTRDISLFLAASFHHRSHSSSASAVLTPLNDRWGATTVASTMHLAHRASIATFVTGGIGGVHRGGEISMDISADLFELARTPVVVVCAGVKSILDIRRTVEVLETQGVPTICYGTDELPAFFSPHSGVKSPARVDDANEIAMAYWAARDMGLSHGMVVAVPNIDPAAGEEVERAIHAALGEAEKQRIQGPAITPFLLKRVAETTSGESIRSNMALVRNNAAIGAAIAFAIAEMGIERMERLKRGTMYQGADVHFMSESPSSRVVVIGGIVVDVVSMPLSGNLILGTSNPTRCVESDGGVGRNIAEVLGRLGTSPLLYSAVGKDSRGFAILQRLREINGVQFTSDTVRMIENFSTASYIAILNGDGDLHVACADMNVMTQIESPSMEVLRQAEIVVMDANVSVPVLQKTARRAVEAGAQVYMDPTSVLKAASIAQDPLLLSYLSAIFPNRDELVAMASSICAADGFPSNSPTDRLTFLEDQARLVVSKLRSEGPAQLIISLGKEGVLFAERGTNSPDNLVVFNYFPVEPHVKVVNATGAGDTLCGAFIHEILQGKSSSEAIVTGMRLANKTLASQRTIAELLS